MKQFKPFDGLADWIWIKTKGGLRQRQRERGTVKKDEKSDSDKKERIRMSTNHSISRCARSNDEGIHQQNETAKAKTKEEEKRKKIKTNHKEQKKNVTT